VVYGEKELWKVGRNGFSTYFSVIIIFHIILLLKESSLED